MHSTGVSSLASAVTRLPSERTSSCHHGTRRRGLRGLHAAALADSQHGWAAGDGGMVLGTADAAIRTWRPEVLVLEEPSEGDALRPSRVRGSATRDPESGRLDATDRAADGSGFLEHQEGLCALLVHRSGRRRHRAGPHPPTARDRRRRPGRRRRQPRSRSRMHRPREVFRLTPAAGRTAAPRAVLRRSSDRARIGVPAKRRCGATERSSRRHPRGEPAAELSYNPFAKSLDDPARRPAYSHRSTSSRPGSPSQAARQLHLLAEAHRVRSRWDLAEQTYSRCRALPARAAGPRGDDLAAAALDRVPSPSGGGCRTKARRPNAAGLRRNARSANRGRPTASPNKAGPRPAAEQIEAAGLGPDPWISKTLLRRSESTPRSDGTTPPSAIGGDRPCELGGLIRRVDPASSRRPRCSSHSRRSSETAGARPRRTFTIRSRPRRRRLAAGRGRGTGTRPSRGPDQVSTALCRRTPQPPHLDGVSRTPAGRPAKSPRWSRTHRLLPLPEGARTARLRR